MPDKKALLMFASAEGGGAHEHRGSASSEKRGRGREEEKEGGYDLDFSPSIQALHRREDREVG